MIHWPAGNGTTLASYTEARIPPESLVEPSGHPARHRLAYAYHAAGLKKQNAQERGLGNIATLYGVQQKALERAYFALCTAEMMEAGASEIANGAGMTLVRYED